MPALKHRELRGGHTEPSRPQCPQSFAQPPWWMGDGAAQAGPQKLWEKSQNCIYPRNSEKDFKKKGAKMLFFFRGCHNYDFMVDCTHDPHGRTGS